MRREKEFTNEIGHPIRIEVEDKELAGVAGTFIAIAGPDSDTTIHITRHEAEVLHELLGQSLESQ